MLLLSALLFSGPDPSPLPFPQRRDHNDPMATMVTWSQWGLIDYTFSNRSLTSTIMYLPGWRTMARNDTFPSSVREIANRTSSALIAIEHRYFGESSPTDMSTENLSQFLTVEQVLGDINFVIETFFGRIKTLVLIGGGYGGVLAAWFKIKYPQHANGVWASSAPILQEPFSGDADGMLVEKLKSTHPGCYEWTKKQMDYLHAVFTHSDEEAKQKMREKWGMPKNLSDVAFLYEVAEAFLLMARSETTNTKLLSAYCYGQKGADMDWLIEMFNRTLAYYKTNMHVLDPYAPFEDNPKGQEIRNMRAKWFLQCTAIGQFNVYNKSAPFRSRLINESFYDDVCMHLFGMPVATDGDFDITYGGLTQGGTSTIFTYSTSDYQKRLMEVATSEANEVYAGVIDDGESYSSDLDTESEQDCPSLKRVRRWAIDVVSNWSKLEFLDNCAQHGKRTLNQCKCDKGWIGPECNVRSVSHSSFKGASAMTTLIPTVVVLVASVVAWKTIINNDDATSTKKIVF